MMIARICNIQKPSSTEAADHGSRECIQYRFVHSRSPRESNSRLSDPLLGVALLLIAAGCGLPVTGKPN